MLPSFLPFFPALFVTIKKFTAAWIEMDPSYHPMAKLPNVPLVLLDMAASLAAHQTAVESLRRASWWGWREERLTVVKWGLPVSLGLLCTEMNAMPTLK